MTMDKAADSADEYLEDIVWSEVEDELDLFSILKEELNREARDGPEYLRIYVKSWSDALGLALDFYEKRLKDSMATAARMDAFAPQFRKTRAELSLISEARDALNKLS